MKKMKFFDTKQENGKESMDMRMFLLLVTPIIERCGVETLQLKSEVTNNWKQKTEETEKEMKGWVGQQGRLVTTKSKKKSPLRPTEVYDSGKILDQKSKKKIEIKKLNPKIGLFIPKKT